MDRCATHETHSYEDEMEETVNLADLESAEIFGGEVKMIITMRMKMNWLTMSLNLR